MRVFLEGHSTLSPSSYWLVQDKAHAFNFLSNTPLPPQVLTVFKKTGAQRGHCIMQEHTSGTGQLPQLSSLNPWAPVHPGTESQRTTELFIPY